MLIAMQNCFLMRSVAFRRTVQRGRQASGVTPSGGGKHREREA